MKAGASASNAEFRALFHRLRGAGIQNKAYFIIGGPKESAESSEETIDFAISSGASLAYFALYKEFVPAVHSLRSEQVKGSDAHRRYAAYDQLKIGWDQVINEAVRNPADESFRRLVAEIDPVEGLIDPAELLAVYAELSQLGFRFSDLVKYSDHHAQSFPASEILNKVNFGDQAEFECKVASAYIQFYTRRAFIDTYKALLADGY